MKRYLLLALLFGIVFLWWGKISVVEAWVQCTDRVEPKVTGHYYSCQKQNDPPPACIDNWVNQWQTCPAQEDCANWYMCCICNAAPTTTPAGNGNWGGSNWSAGTTNPDGLTNEKCAAVYNANSNPNGLGSWGKLNASGLGCTCEGWYKKIDHACVPCNTKGVCCGIELNTNVPFIGRCIEGSTGDVGDDEQAVTSEDAFPVLMGSLTQILVTIILIVSFVLIIVGGIMISTGNLSGGKSLIIKVVIGIALLGASGVILRLINPNFFW
jgi:hypothetical protein